MKQNNSNQDSYTKNLLKRFAHKGGKKKVVIGNRAVIYYRVSSKKQLEHGNSLEWQKELCEKYCRDKGYEIVEYFGGTFESAQTDEDRAEFSRMMKLVKTGKPKIDRIVCYSFDRFSRSGDTTMLDELLEIGVSVESVTQLGDDNSPTGLFMKKMFSLFNNEENQLRRGKTRDGMKAKLRRGEVVGQPPIGYDKIEVSEKISRCEINEAGKFIRQAFMWAAEQSMTNTEIVHRLNNMGLKISGPLLSRVFRNVFYIGYITNNLLDEGEMIKGTHEPLISEEIFLQVNKMLEKNPSGWTVKRDSDNMPLKIFVKCDKCGKSLTSYPQKGKYHYYKCPTTSCCVNISNIRLHGLFTDKLKQYIIDPKSIPGLQIQLVATYWKLHESDAARVKPLKDELTVLKNELDNLERNFVFGKIPQDLYSKYATSQKQRIAVIEDDLEKIAVDTSNLEKRLEIALQNTSNLLEIWELLNHKGKQRLQYLVFPQGMTYDKENGELRTQAVNPMFSAINCLAQVSSNQQASVLAEQEEVLLPVYQAFPSSNFFWEVLGAITEVFEDLALYYPAVWESIKISHLDPATGHTETVEYRYVSDTSGYVLSGTPIAHSTLTNTIRMTLIGKNYSGNTTYCAINEPYVFAGLKDGNYTLYSAYEDEAKGYADIYSLLLSANTVYNPVLIK